MTGYQVKCEDGAVRHAEPFATVAEAEEFAEWGHICTNHHRITWTGSAATGDAQQSRPVERSQG